MTLGYVAVGVASCWVWLSEVTLQDRALPQNTDVKVLLCVQLFLSPSLESPALINITTQDLPVKTGNKSGNYFSLVCFLDVGVL